MKDSYFVAFDGPSWLHKLRSALSLDDWIRRAARYLPDSELPTQIYLGSLKRPQYAMGLYAAALEAKALGIERISAIEFGVASGHGLLNMEALARRLGRFLDVEIQVYGFDMGSGLPKPKDYRDLPYVFAEGDYLIDEQALRARLNGAGLYIGPVAENLHMLDGAPPVGFIAFDLDLYSSTVDAMHIFDFPPATRLPHVICYFDDVLAPDIALYSEHTGELLAITEFNERNAGAKSVSPWASLKYTKLRPAMWHAQMYIMQDFQHADYGRSLLPADRRQMGSV
jgi:hypothetical protein